MSWANEALRDLMSPQNHQAYQLWQRASKTGL